MQQQRRPGWGSQYESDGGEDRRLNTARAVYRAMDRTTTMTEETLRTFAEFGFTRDQLVQPKTGGEGPQLGPLDRSLRFLERQISRCLDSQRPIWSDSNNTRDFLEAVDTLIDTVRGLDPMVPGDKRILEFTTDILDKSMTRLADEFRYLMDLGNSGGTPLGPFTPSLALFDGVEETDDDPIPVAPVVKDYNVIIDALPWGTIADLQGIASRMVEARYSKECADVYILARRDFLEESLARMGLLGWSPAEVHSAPWNELEKEIKRWVQGSKVAFLVLFPSELRLCTRVFRDVNPSFTDLVFAEVCRVSSNQLVGFADSIASGNRSPERLFGIVDMYESLRDLFPEIQSVFCDPRSSFVVEDSSVVLSKLAETIRGILTELENLIHRDPPAPVLPGGGTHHITRYVMNYLRAASASWRTLEEVLEEEEHGGGRAASPRHDGIRPNSALSVRLSWIVNRLLTNLDAKAAEYRDASLGSFFLLNNGRYVAKKASDELGQILGESWVRGQLARVRQWQAAYSRHTWGRMVEVLRTDDVGYGNGGDVLASLKEKVRRFDALLEAVQETQVGWAVADEELREELIRAALDAVGPAYMALMARFRGGGREVMRQMDRIVKYTEADLQRVIRGLYQGR